MPDDAPSTPSPDEAFAALGNETRLAILRALGDADGPLAFSALYDRVDVSDSGQFNYHLDRLTDHFVRHSEEGYELARPGSRIVEAVLSGAVTDTPVLEPTEVDHPCPFCGAPVEVTFRDERVELYCTECAGNYGAGAKAAPDGASGVEDGTDGDRERDPGTVTSGDGAYGYLGYHPLPPAGVQGRDADAVLSAARTWGYLELMAAAGGVCPRCSAPLDREVRVCEAHDASDGICPNCDDRYAVGVTLRCRNCIYDEGGSAAVALAGATPLLAFLTARGYDPVTSDPGTHAAVSRTLNDYEETVLSTDPFRARFTFAVDGDELALTVDADMDVVEAVERSGTGSD
jgi:ribosomal protein L37AE/L43A